MSKIMSAVLTINKHRVDAFSNSDANKYKIFIIIIIVILHHFISSVTLGNLFSLSGAVG